MPRCSESCASRSFAPTTARRNPLREYDPPTYETLHTDCSCLATRVAGYQDLEPDSSGGHSSK